MMRKSEKMSTVCDIDMCTGCRACENVCPKNAIRIEDSIGALNAIIDKEKCVDCDTCKKVCPNEVLCELREPIFWKQGWAPEEIRQHSASGGAASAIIMSFVKKGGYVVSCLFEDGDFIFKATNNVKDINKFAGSKYVKSNPQNIYEEIKTLLSRGEKVLFIGLPCQVAGVISLYREYEELYTMDLICHGTPSPSLLKQYISDEGIIWETITQIDFRNNNRFGISINGSRIKPNRVLDSYLLAFLNSLNYTENCYSCRYASIKRVSDITLGDAWGQLSDKMDKGVSLILCQSEKGIALLETAELHLEEVDLSAAVDANHQLKHPSNRHIGRRRFMKSLKKNGNFKRAVFIALPIACIKQKLKDLLIELHIIKDYV
ncbi:MAG: Coenzyme F420 hydrogenase/dehydrogenase, beta subunit C-terminal domain [Lachnospiraceae bacterium]|nr:Coenzyme F420 hydrogenase/dehydrogenase, beta subunit C-terminal domain [Lachnospiraceae bacterium]